MKVSIAMATYNGEKYLGEQLLSLALQLRLPDELVISDDFSTDGTLGVIEEFKNSAPFEVKVLANSTRVGCVGNFSKALSRCSGDLVFLCDQDDFWLSNKIQAMEVEAIEQPGISVFVCDKLIVDASLNSMGISKIQSLVRHSFGTEHLIPACSTAIRKEFLELVLPFPEDTLGFDLWIHKLGILLNTRSVVPEILQLYRRHEYNLSSGISSSPSLASWRQNWRASYDRLRERSARLESDYRFWNSLQIRLLDAGDKKSNLPVKDEYVRASAAARMERDFFGERLNAVNETGFRRLRNIFALWRKGGYRNASGFRGASVDLMAFRR